MKKLRLGIIGGGPGSWIGHVHRIASRFDEDRSFGVAMHSVAEEVH